MASKNYNHVFASWNSIWGGQYIVDMHLLSICARELNAKSSCASIIYAKWATIKLKYKKDEIPQEFFTGKVCFYYFSFFISHVIKAKKSRNFMNLYMNIFLICHLRSCVFNKWFSTKVTFLIWLDHEFFSCVFSNHLLE